MTINEGDNEWILKSQNTENRARVESFQTKINSKHNQKY